MSPVDRLQGGYIVYILSSNMHLMESGSICVCQEMLKKEKISLGCAISSIISFPKNP